MMINWKTSAGVFLFTVSMVGINYINQFYRTGILNVSNTVICTVILFLAIVIGLLLVVKGFREN